MARKVMVTRNIESVVASVMVCNTSTGLTENKEFVIYCKCKDEKALMKEVAKQIGTDEVAVKVINTRTETNKYGMELSLFMELAVLVDESEVADNE